GRFDWVVVDSLTFLFQLIGGKELTEVFMANKDVRRAYGRAGAAVSSIIHDLVLLRDTNVIFTAHLAKESDEEAISMDTRLGEHQVKLAVTPMVWKILGPAVSFIGRTYKKDES
ncbi:MAG: AAA family ATPase, partial [Anaerolineae bacterium]|nr:AAA family ATPase [Thermoplasmata archaeon]NIV30342.1 AAA family ATPase [Anaerolineae bacterium]NIY05613.1 AAA family ATPase [Thermoplasmata archaeon]